MTTMKIQIQDIAVGERVMYNNDSNEVFEVIGSEAYLYDRSKWTLRLKGRNCRTSMTADADVEIRVIDPVV